MKTPHFLTLFLLVFSTALPAQVSFKAVPNKTSAKVGEKIQLSYIITTTEDLDFGQITFPRFVGFQMVGRNVGQSYSYANGKTTKQYMETVVLLPQREGKLTVKEGAVEVNGKMYQSNEVTFEITKATPQNDNSTGQLVFMDVHLTKDKAYPNETLNAEVKLYAKSFDALRRRSDLEVPGMSDFQVTELSKNQERDFHQESINNQVFISEKIAVYQLQPTKTGKIEVPPFTIRVAIPIGFFDEKIVEVKSKPVYLNVNEFPPNAPSNFTGAVGDFDFVTYVDQTQSEVNKSIAYEIELVGEGNFSSIRLPKINAPKAFEIYPPKTRHSYKATASGEKGKLVDSYVLVPQYGGDYVIPSVEFSYFDTTEGSYKTISSEEKTIAVKGKTEDEIIAESRVAIDTAGIGIDSVEDNNSIIPELPKQITRIFDKSNEDDEGLDASIPETNNNFGWYYLGLVPIAAGLLWFFVLRPKNKDEEETSQFIAKQSEDNLKQGLSELRIATQSNDQDKFYQQANTVLNDTISYIAKDDRLYDINSAKHILSTHKSEAFALQWEKLYNQTQMMKYGAASNSMKISEFYVELDHMIKELLNK